MTTMRGFTEHDLALARDRFYPDWWLHHTVVRDATDMPHYRVVCRSLEDRELALACKPHYVSVRVTLVRDQRDQRDPGASATDARAV